MAILHKDRVTGMRDGERDFGLQLLSGQEQILGGKIGFTCEIDSQAPQSGFIAGSGDVGDVNFAAS